MRRILLHPLCRRQVVEQGAVFEDDRQRYTPLRAPFLGSCIAEQRLIQSALSIWAIDTPPVCCSVNEPTSL